MIEVWEPKWSTREVLVAKYKVKKGMNIIKITGGAAKGRYRMSQIAIKSYPTVSNGSIDCFALPLDKMERL